jgi:ribosomal protein L35
MPKLRTKSAIKKRFRATKNGKVLFNTSGDAKLHAHKSRKTKRRYGRTEVLIEKALAAKVKRALSI